MGALLLRLGAIAAGVVTILMDGDDINSKRWKTKDGTIIEEDA